MNTFFKNWDLKRAFYLIGGLAFLAIAIVDKVWWIGLFGLYYAAMAIFRFGCAAGNCQVDIKNNTKEK